MAIAGYSLKTLPDFVGKELGESSWVQVDQQRIDQFAEATGDHQWIHVDPQRAAAGPFGATIAHGFLTLSMLSRLGAMAISPPATSMTLNYGFDRVRFLNPVRSGQRIRGVFKLKELVEKRPGQWQQVLEATVEIEGADKPAMIAEWIVQHFA